MTTKFESKSPICSLEYKVNKLMQWDVCTLIKKKVIKNIVKIKDNKQMDQNIGILFTW